MDRNKSPVVTPGRITTTTAILLHGQNRAKNDGDSDLTFMWAVHNRSNRHQTS
ncbi:hypothetical protein PGT21_016840 [Puccinia graminis f. sp. tritici]|uniref:Uncharacterized protein n=1 Tax=Puccinia graminis f. sp. tritici TaxID=56615 RepID=A0A5B0R1I8_PUCGR|nr:hypothetical protein PGT21_016840 [Puccinia graminis f. sp. tritici]